MKDVLELLRQLEQAKFYGSLEVKLEAGQVVLIRKTETINPRATDYRKDRGTHHANTASFE